MQVRPVYADIVLSRCLHCRHQRQLPDASPASLLGKIHQLQDQRDEMNSQLFNLRRSNETLQQDNMSLTAQNTTLQRQNAQSRQDTQDVKDQVSILCTPDHGASHYFCMCMYRHVQVDQH